MGRAVGPGTEARAADQLAGLPYSSSSLLGHGRVLCDPGAAGTSGRKAAGGPGDRCPLPSCLAVHFPFSVPDARQPRAQRGKPHGQRSGCPVLAVDADAHAVAGGRVALQRPLAPRLSPDVESQPDSWRCVGQACTFVHTRALGWQAVRPGSSPTSQPHTCVHGACPCSRSHGPTRVRSRTHSHVDGLPRAGTLTLRLVPTPRAHAHVGSCSHLRALDTRVHAHTHTSTTCLSADECVCSQPWQCLHDRLHSCTVRSHRQPRPRGPLTEHVLLPRAALPSSAGSRGRGDCLPAGGVWDKGRWGRGLGVPASSCQLALGRRPAGLVAEQGRRDQAGGTQGLLCPLGSQARGLHPVAAPCWEAGTEGPTPGHSGRLCRPPGEVSETLPCGSIDD